MYSYTLQIIYIFPRICALPRKQIFTWPRFDAKQFQSYRHIYIYVGICSECSAASFTLPHRRSWYFNPNKYSIEPKAKRILCEFITKSKWHIFEINTHLAQLYDELYRYYQATLPHRHTNCFGSAAHSIIKNICGHLKR